MKNVINLLVLIAFLMISNGCVSYDIFYKKSKPRSVTIKSYSPNDNIFIRDYALYNSIEEELLIPNNQPFEINKDSLVLVIQDSFKKLSLNSLKLHFNENIVDSTLYYKSVFNINKIRNDYFEKFSENLESEIILVPIIYSYNSYFFTAFFTSGGGFGDNGWSFITYLDLIVFMIKNKEIIYSRHIRYKSDQIWADTNSEIEAIPPLAAVKQEHWDELVRLAMEDYIKRLK